jgi:hypothetical protein
MGTKGFVYKGNVQDIPAVLVKMMAGGGLINGQTVPAAATGFASVVEANGYGWLIIYT